MSSYTFTKVNENHTIAAVYYQTKPSYRIDSGFNNSGYGAHIDFSLSGDINPGSSQTSTITADIGYEILGIRVNSIPLTNSNSLFTGKTHKFKKKSFSSLVASTIDDVQADYLVAVNVEKTKAEYTININIKGKGAVDAANTFVVAAGSDEPLRFIPTEGYHVGEVIDNGESIGPMENLSLTNIKQDHEITVIFVKDQESYTIRSSVTGKGEITPTGATLVADGDSAPYVFTAATGYQLVDVIIDGTSLKNSNGIGSGNVYLFTNVIMNHTIDAVYQKVATSYEITTLVGAGGSATYTGIVAVNSGASHLIQTQADAGFHVTNIKVDGLSLGAITSYEFSNVICNHQVEIEFGIDQDAYEITITSGANGTVEPSNLVTVVAGDNQLIQFIPDLGYRVLNVSINGISKGSITSALMRTVQSDQTIVVTFTELQNEFSITAEMFTVGELNTLSISGIKNGGSTTYEFQPTVPAIIVDIKVDGVSYGTVNSYTFADVTEDHTITYYVEKDTTVTPASTTHNSGGCQYTAKTSPFNALELLFLLLLTLLSTRFTRKQK